MRLSLLSEAEVSRRNFLKRAGASSILPSLINTGMAPETAKIFAGPNAPKLFLSTSYSNEQREWWTPADNEFKSIISNYNLVRKLSGKDSTVYHGPTNDNYIVGTFISPQDLSQLLNDPTIKLGNDDSEESHIDRWFKIGDKSFQIISSNHYGWDEQVGGLADNDLLNGWWQDWGQYRVQPMGDAMLNKLKRAGIDPSDREDWVKEKLANEIDRIPEDYGNKEKYGIEEQPQHQEPENIQVPDDYKMASSMHQPFESRINRILGL